MEAVPLMAYLARRDRDYDEVSRHPKPVDVQAATEAWYDKGLADGRQKAKGDCDEAIRRHEEESKAKLDRARKIWAETESAALARQTASAIAALKAEIEDGVARILRPLLEKRLVDEALTKLAIEMGKLLSDDDAIKFQDFRSAGPRFPVERSHPRTRPCHGECRRTARGQRSCK